MNGILYGSDFLSLFIKFVFLAVVAYLLGSINGAIITSKYYYKKDIRDFGSGNAGLTNFYRVFGKYGAALVVVIDIMKSVIPVLLAGWVMGLTGRWADGCAFAGFFAMLGHSYPIYYNFKGGKTVMAGGTIVWFVDWRVGIIVWAIFIIIVIITRYISLGSVIGGIMYPISLAAIGINSWFAVFMVALSGALLVFRHKENIKRIIKGTESKIKFKK